MTTTMAKVILAVGALICGVDAMNKEISSDVSEMENKLSALYEQVEKDTERVAAMKAKYAELFTCLNMEEGKNVVLKEGCNLVVKKGNHKIEGQFHILGTQNIDGGNLHVHNGSGSPDCSKTECNGRGNLIIGHSPESSKIFHKDLSGSHNIIVGSGHAVYSHGSIVSGSDHTLLGAHSSAISGISNTAASEGSAVLGGSNNLAGDIMGRVDSEDDAVHKYATVTGGYNNTAIEGMSSVSGGKNNIAKSMYSYCAGGSDNIAGGGYYATAIGGKGNQAKGRLSTILGGKDTEVTGIQKVSLGD
jgi:hypothetical protein